MRKTFFIRSWENGSPWTGKEAGYKWEKVEGHLIEWEGEEFFICKHTRHWQVYHAPTGLMVSYKLFRPTMRETKQAFFEFVEQVTPERMKEVLRESFQRAESEGRLSPYVTNPPSEEEKPKRTRRKYGKAEIFYKRVRDKETDEWRWEERKGYRIVYEGEDFFIHQETFRRKGKDVKRWTVTHGRTGLGTGSVEETSREKAEDAFRSAMENISRERFEQAIKNALRLHGESPLYAKKHSA